MPFVMSSTTLCSSGVMTRWAAAKLEWLWSPQSGYRMARRIWEKMMRKQFTTIVLALVLVAPQSAFSWNGRGHMMVAAVAYQKLNQGTKDRVDALLLLNPDRDNWLDLIPASTPPGKVKMMVFMIAATWADRIKSDPDYRSRRRSFLLRPIPQEI